MKLKTIVVVALMWVTIGTVHALSRYSDIVKYNLDVVFTLREGGFFVLSYALWIIVTLALLRIIGAPRFDMSFQRMAALFIVGALVWLPSYFAIDFAISTWIDGGGWDQWLDKFSATSGSIVFFYAVVYALTFALCVGVVFSARARDADQANILLERQTARARLELAEQHMQLMQSQLSPHFLFNALGAISYLGRRGERKSLVDAIAKLGTLLRFTIENASRRLITVLEELQFAKDYVGLQQLRFGERFTCTFACDSDIKGERCPPFTLQPLLENVFQHVVEQMPDKDDSDAHHHISIRVSIAARDDRLLLSVWNSRDAKQDITKPTAGHGTGVNNLKTRLAHIYADAFTLEQLRSPSEFRVDVSFPMVADSADV